MLTPGLAAIDAALPEGVASRSPLAKTWRQLQHQLDDFIDAGLGAA